MADHEVYKIALYIYLKAAVNLLLSRPFFLPIIPAKKCTCAPREWKTPNQQRGPTSPSMPKIPRPLHHSSDPQSWTLRNRRPRCTWKSRSCPCRHRHRPRLRLFLPSRPWCLGAAVVLEGGGGGGGERKGRANGRFSNSWGVYSAKGHARMRMRPTSPTVWKATDD